VYDSDTLDIEYLLMRSHAVCFSSMELDVSSRTLIREVRGKIRAVWWIL
jgi:hypothetical protein